MTTINSILANPSQHLAERDHNAIKASLSLVQAGGTKKAGLSEDRLYAALIHARLTASNPKLAEKFAAKLPAVVEQYNSQGQTLAYFRAADRVMRQFVRDKEINMAEYRGSRDFAFGYAQLDTDRTSLGGKSTTEATDLINNLATGQAATAQEIGKFRKDQAKISRERWKEQKVAALEASASSRTASASSVGSSTISGISNGFLWKPESDSDGKLAILLPSSWSGNVLGVSVLGPDGKVLEAGRYAGNGNGGRDHFRFSRDGGSFPAGCVVLVQMRDGTTQRIAIENPASRIESK